MARKVLDDTKKTIGETIKQLRKENLWTQEELASRIKTTTISVSRWEKNLTRPSLHFQQKLCEIFGKSPEELGFLPQSEPEHGEGSQSNDQHQEMEPGQRVSVTKQEPATSSVSLLASVPPPPLLQHTFIPRNIVLRATQTLSPGDGLTKSPPSPERCLLFATEYAFIDGSPLLLPDPFLL
ncbi:helix-turn-helix transcriptional regulator [Reticulibacter mediterranei]|uniref:helix-turn-helix transcriptional regulator n=1 Tax=Reticulibacter mediterranei TaxID=2778369 RepID=UPI001C68798C|nr:helix-turn-helix transcriptional regulator [Reticulibacter mediterranei]